MDKQQKFIDFPLQWLNKPTNFSLQPSRITIKTEPKTDLWQRTFYGFRNDNAPILFTLLPTNFTIQVKTSFTYKKMYDQCGLILYQDSENWWKMGIQYENEQYCRLGSVATNFGYSDWATTDIPTSGMGEMWYRVSRRGQDFLLESSGDGKEYQQMRILHMHKEIEIARIGIYACSPLDSSFQAQFHDPVVSECIWQAYKAPN